MGCPNNRLARRTIECSHMKLLCLGALCALLCLVPVVVAQKAAAPQKAAPAGPSTPESDDPTRIILDVTRVNILFTVTDKKGRFVTDLTKADFDVVENKKQQTIQQF